MVVRDKRNERLEGRGLRGRTKKKGEWEGIRINRLHVVSGESEKIRLRVEKATKIVAVAKAHLQP